MEIPHKKVTDIQIVFGFIVVLYILHLFDRCFSPIKDIFLYIGDIIYWYGYSRTRSEVPWPKIKFNANNFTTIVGVLIIIIFYFFII